MEAYPLITRTPNPGTIFDIISGKILYALGRKPSRPLHIPKIAAGKSTSFISLLPESESRGPSQIAEVSEKEFLDLLKTKSLAGRGGGAFPVYKKIEALKQAGGKNRICIINGVECDPGLVHDAWLLEHNRDDISCIISLLRRYYGFTRVILAVTPDKAGIYIDGAETAVVPDTYPAGAESRLIRSLLDIDIAPHDYPTRQGILVQNVQTLCGIYHALSSTSEEDIRYITALNLKSGESFVIQTENGTPIGDIARTVFPKEDTLFVGGGIMQARLPLDNEILTDSINCITLSEKPRFKEKDCRGCYQCNIHCPADLDIKRISEAVRDSKPDTIPPDLDPKLCPQCGSCTYVCPAGIDLCSDCRSLQ